MHIVIDILLMKQSLKNRKAKGNGIYPQHSNPAMATVHLSTGAVLVEPRKNPIL